MPRFLALAALLLSTTPVTAAEAESDWQRVRSELLAIEPGSWSLMGPVLNLWRFQQDQHEDGLWRPAAASPGVPGVPAEHQPIALTGLTLLTYLGAGYDHGHPNRFRTTVDAGLEALLRAQADDGWIARDHRSQALAVLALAEAYAMTQHPKLRDPVADGLAALMDAAVTDDDGRLRGWPGDELAGLDPGATCWAIMAWKSARAGGVVSNSREAELHAATAALATALRADPAAHEHAAAVALAMIFAGHGSEGVTDLAQISLAQLLAHEQAGSVDALLAYRTCLACFQLGGEHWAAARNLAWRWYDRGCRRALARERVGDWITDDATHGGADAALATLMIEVFYRYLPVATSAPEEGGDDPELTPLPPPPVDLALLERLTGIEELDDGLLDEILRFEFGQLGDELDDPEARARFDRLLQRFGPLANLLNARIGPAAAIEWVHWRPPYGSDVSHDLAGFAWQDIRPWQGELLSLVAERQPERIPEILTALAERIADGAIEADRAVTAYRRASGPGRLHLLQMIALALRRGAELPALPAEPLFADLVAESPIAAAAALVLTAQGDADELVRARIGELLRERPVPLDALTAVARHPHPELLEPALAAADVLDDATAGELVRGLLRGGRGSWPQLPLFSALLREAEPPPLRLVLDAAERWPPDAIAAAVRTRLAAGHIDEELLELVDRLGPGAFADCQSALADLRVHRRIETRELVVRLWSRIGDGSRELAGLLAATPGVSGSALVANDLAHHHPSWARAQLEDWWGLSETGRIVTLRAAAWHSLADALAPARATLEREAGALETAAACLVVGVVGAAEDWPRLQVIAVSDRRHYVRLAAAVALLRQGDDSARTVLATALPTAAERRDLGRAARWLNNEAHAGGLAKNGLTLPLLPEEFARPDAYARFALDCAAIAPSPAVRDLLRARLAECTPPIDDHLALLRACAAQRWWPGDRVAVEAILGHPLPPPTPPACWLPPDPSPPPWRHMYNSHPPLRAEHPPSYAAAEGPEPDRPWSLEDWLDALAAIAQLPSLTIDTGLDADLLARLASLDPAALASGLDERALLPLRARLALAARWDHAFPDHADRLRRSHLSATTACELEGVRLRLLLATHQALDDAIARWAGDEMQAELREFRRLIHERLAEATAAIAERAPNADHPEAWWTHLVDRRAALEAILGAEAVAGLLAGRAER